MCLIVDANLASLVFGENPNDDFRPIIDWLNQKNGKFVLGGHLAVEYNRIANLRSHIIELWRKGIARIIPSGPINEEEKRIADSCRSDDPHIIALARVSGARILCSLDKTLHKDFRNPKLIDDYRGHIYQNAEHEHLLREYGHTSACGQCKS
jgi:hypothetical protein